ncbi:flagellar export protein FliJ [Ornithinibacillus xuwenensis]|uniref:Flagellar FliJ protein n=1 Tax=Ornithinibacillus xuwenensis TaxID=3144668 RepID=A0ABU9XDU8_9BACI
MAGTIALSKILDIREQEKKDAQLAYHQSVDSFEQVATKLFNILKRKEMAEEAYDEALKESMHLDYIQDQLMYIETLNKKILELQGQVQQARTTMESKQVKLSNAHVETKKFEKIIEFRINEESDARKRAEDSLMDEISIQQYLSHKK